MSFSAALAGSFVIALTVGGCAAETPAVATDDAPVVGVTDLGALESELGLTADTRDANGAWSRGDAKLTAGPCFGRTVGADRDRWEFRRYAHGAAFFAKRGTAAATGDARPVVCVDVDVALDYAPGERTLGLHGIALDLAWRYRLGAVAPDMSFVGHAYRDFAAGRVEAGEAGRFCSGFRYAPGFDSPNGVNPAVAAGEGSACEAAFAADNAADTIDRPTWDGARYFYRLDPQVGSSVSGSLASSAPGIAELGVSHRQLVDEVRRDAAERLLANGTLPIGEVAYLAGFSDASAFHHAFARWTGMTPAAYRASR